MQTNYSYETSLKPYLENQSGKQIQAQKILEAIEKGCCTLIQLSRVVGLPQSTVSGRISDLLKLNKIVYKGVIEFEGRKRKKIVRVGIFQQGELF